MKGVFRQLLVSLLLGLLPLIGSTAFVDDSARRNEILRLLQPGLDAQGIDVRGDKVTSAAFGGSRPQLSLLETIPAEPLAVKAAPDRFGQLFEAGAFSDAVLVATRTRENRRVNLSEAEFQQRWNAASASERVFISFSGNDVRYAEVVRAAFEAKGYVTFLYKDSSSKYPKTNSVQVGTYCKEAGHHFIVDTANARASLGVITEALALQAMRRGTRPSFPDAPNSGLGPGPGPRPEGSRSGSPGLGERGGEPCCRLCRYRNGVRIGCGPVQCGTQCYGAR